MKRQLSAFLIFISFSLWGNGASTIFKWIQKDGNIHQAGCYEVDSETGGGKYSDKVDAKLCKPKDWIYVFDLKKGKCYEADKATTGNLYYNKVYIDFCRPKETMPAIVVINGKSGCYEVDTKTNGSLFYEKTHSRKCDDVKHETYWISNGDLGGTCFRVSLQDQDARLKVKDEECKPHKTIFRFHRTSPFSGSCHETHPADPKRFATKAKIESCKPPQTVFIFYRKEGEVEGKCFELDEETKGDHYLNRVKIENCKNTM